MKKSYLILLAFLLCLVACNRDDQDIILDETPIDITGPMLQVNGDIVGQVIDINGEPIMDAKVTYDGVTTDTDEFGAFYFKDQTLYKDGTYLVVNKSGYHHGSRKFYAVENQVNTVKIQLVERVEIGTFSVETGGSLSTESLSIKFPAGDYKTASGQDILGDVSVSAYYLDPTLDETYLQMPGDLSGVDSEGRVNTLQSMGMAAIELADANGESVLLPEGSVATLTFDVPQSLLNQAPQTIPLWYFDEDNGIWIEDGEAYLIDGQYQGEVEHFTYWNCDIPSETVTIEGTILVFGEALSGGAVQVEDANTGWTGFGYLSSEGYFIGEVPINSSLIFSLIDPCGISIGSTDIGPYSEDTNLGTLDIEYSLQIVTLTGNVTNCANTPSDQYLALIDFGINQTVVLADENGEFSYTTPACASGEVEAFGIDQTNNLISAGAIIDTETTTDFGTLVACDTLVEEFLSINYDNMGWDSSAANENLAHTYTTQIFESSPLKYIIEFTLLDWVQSPNLYPMLATFTYTEGESVGTVNADFKIDGFMISTECTVATFNQGNETFRRFTFSTDEVDVYDTSLFPGDVGTVTVNLTF